MVAASCLIMLVCRYEPLFYAAFAIPFILHVRALQQRPQAQARATAKQSVLATETAPVSMVPLFMSFKLLVYTLLAFFGTGNFASIASFSLPSVYRLVTVFAPFTMSALLIGKIFIPLIFLAAAFGALLRSLRLFPMSVFLLLIGTIDIMTLNFFFLVRDQGSWLEIGTSISHFVISSVFSVVTLLLYGLSEVLLPKSE